MAVSTFSGPSFRPDRSRGRLRGPSNPAARRSSCRIASSGSSCHTGRFAGGASVSGEVHAEQSFREYPESSTTQRSDDGIRTKPPSSSIQAHRCGSDKPASECSTVLLSSKLSSFDTANVGNGTSMDGVDRKMHIIEKAQQSYLHSNPVFSTARCLMPERCPLHSGGGVCRY